MSDENRPLIEELTITEKAIPAEYSKDYPFKGSIERANFEYKDSKPVRIRTFERSFEVKTSSETTAAETFFQHKIAYDEAGNITSISFKNPHAAKVFGVLYTSTVSRNLQLIDSTYDAETTEVAGRGLAKAIAKGKKLYTIARTNGTLTKSYKTADKAVKTDAVDVGFGEDNVFDDIAKQVLAWIEETQKAKVEVTIQNIKVATGRTPTNLTRIKLGKVQESPAEVFGIEEVMIESLLYAAETLKLEPPKNLFVIDVRFLGFNNELGRRLNDVPGAADDVGGFAERDRGTIVLKDSKVLKNSEHSHIVETEVDGNKIKVTTREVINKAAIIKTGRHEVAHIVDPGVNNGTTPQKEGFARAFEYGFSYGVLVNLLKRSDFNKEITPDLLIDVLGWKQTHSHTVAETYTLSASFFAYMYEKLGPDSFMTYYSLLSRGQLPPRNTTQIEKLSALSNTLVTTWFKGRVMDCFKMVPKDFHWTYKSPEDFVKAYIDETNERLKK